MVGAPAFAHCRPPCTAHTVLTSGMCHGTFPPRSAPSLPSGPLGSAPDCRPRLSVSPPPDGARGARALRRRSSPRRHGRQPKPSRPSRPVPTSGMAAGSGTTVTFPGALSAAMSVRRASRRRTWARVSGLVPGAKAWKATVARGPRPYTPGTIPSQVSAVEVLRPRVLSIVPGTPP